MRLSVPILTCDRYDLTVQTVESFIRHNGREHDFYYADDASKDMRVHDYMAEKGIPCLVRHDRRRGCTVTTDELFRETVKQNGNAFLLHLQNDFETVRPIPFGVVEQVFQDERIGWVRLYGTHEKPNGQGRRCGTKHGGKPNRTKQADVVWEQFELDGEQLERGDIHWCYHPNIVRQELAVPIMRGCVKEIEPMKNSAKLDKLTVRFFNNITSHLVRHGEGTTPRGIFYP